MRNILPSPPNTLSPYRVYREKKEPQASREDETAKRRDEEKSARRYPLPAFPMSIEAGGERRTGETEFAPRPAVRYEKRDGERNAADGRKRAGMSNNE